MARSDPWHGAQCSSLRSESCCYVLVVFKTLCSATAATPVIAMLVHIVLSCCLERQHGLQTYRPRVQWCCQVCLQRSRRPAQHPGMKRLNRLNPSRCLKRRSAVHKAKPPGCSMKPRCALKLQTSLISRVVSVGMQCKLPLRLSQDAQLLPVRDVTIRASALAVHS